jgi:hypothetical protein
MKKNIWIVVIFLFLGFAKSQSATTWISGDTLWVGSDAAAGDLNTIIIADSAANHIIGLMRGSLYIIEGSIQVNQTNRTLRLYGQPGTKDTCPAIIQPASDIYCTANIASYGSVEASNIWFIYVDVTGALEWDQMTFYTNGTHCKFDNCIFEYDMAPTMYTQGTHFNAYFTNCLFRNCIDPGQWWAGRSIYYEPNVASADTVVSENCTYENMGFGIQTQGQPIGWANYNHNTFVNIAKFAIQESFWSNVRLTNNIFYNCHFTGERVMDRPGQDPDLLLYGVICIDTNNRTIDVTNGTTEANRVMLVANNANYRDPWFDNGFYTTYDNQDTVSDPIIGEPFMNGRGYAFFDKNLYTLGGNMKMQSNYIDDNYTGIYNPRFIAAQTNKDSIYTYLEGTYYPTKVSVNWGSDQFDGNYSWPFPDNYAYTNDTLLKGGYSGLPVGDLNWFPAKKALWSSASDLALSQTKITSVIGNNNNTPVAYTLNQNYPNPFNPSTKINFTVPVSGNVTLKVYDVLGKEIVTLVSGMQTAGEHFVTFDAAKYASGVYFYRLQAGNQQITKKMLLTK